jgi:HEPN domain-containing protein
MTQRGAADVSRSTTMLTRPMRTGAAGAGWVGFPSTSSPVGIRVTGTLRLRITLKGLAYPRAHDVARLLRDQSIVGALLTSDEVGRVEAVSKALSRDRELSFDGDEDVVPLEYYERSDADTALASLFEVLEIVERAFERNRTPIT